MKYSSTTRDTYGERLARKVEALVALVDNSKPEGWLSIRNKEVKQALEDYKKAMEE